MVEKDFQDFFNCAGRKKDYMGDLIIIKTRGIKNCRLQIIDSIPQFDLFTDQEYGIIKVMFRTAYHEDYKIIIGTERNFDTLFIIGLSREKKIIERVFAIPKKELDNIKNITITKNSPKYLRFKIDEKPYIQIYEKIKKGEYSILTDSDITIIE
jgi:hypothetical protein